MLYHLSNLIANGWGPLRLFRSHALLLAGGTLLASLVVLLFLPKLWQHLPHDQGKALVQPVASHAEIYAVLAQLTPEL